MNRKNIKKPNIYRGLFTKKLDESIQPISDNSLKLENAVLVWGEEVSDIARVTFYKLNGSAIALVDEITRRPTVHPEAGKSRWYAIHNLYAHSASEGKRSLNSLKKYMESKGYELLGEEIKR